MVSGKLSAMNANITFYWHDYESWGQDPKMDRPAQFAGLRTDLELRPLGEPLMIYCQPPADVLPQPGACLITKIAPQKALAEGLPEREFAAAVHAELSRPGTCGAGYNSLRFDDELTRHLLYRNFFDPYAREYAQGCSRWDLIDVARLCHGLRPHALEWPQVDGKVSFKLEHLTAANGLSHANAHDALADVEATIALARRLKSAEPQLFDWAFESRFKEPLRAKIDLYTRAPMLHVSGMFGLERGCMGLVMPLAWHPINRNGLIVVDLAQDPRPLLELDAEALAARVFTASEALPEGQARVALKVVHLNKCPLLLSPKMLDGQAAARLKIDRAACERHWQLLLRADLADKLRAVFQRREFGPAPDPELALYDGFIPDTDRRLAERVRQSPPERLDGISFTDPRLNTLLARYKARNYPEALTPEERAQWREHVRRCLNEGGAGRLSAAQVLAEIVARVEQGGLDKASTIVLQQLYRYVQDLQRQYELGPKCRW